MYWLAELDTILIDHWGREPLVYVAAWMVFFMVFFSCFVIPSPYTSMKSAHATAEDHERCASVHSYIYSQGKTRKVQSGAILQNYSGWEPLVYVAACMAFFVVFISCLVVPSPINNRQVRTCDSGWPWAVCVRATIHVLSRKDQKSFIFLMDKTSLCDVWSLISPVLSPENLIWISYSHVCMWEWHMYERMYADGR